MFLSLGHHAVEKLGVDGGHAVLSHEHSLYPVSEAIDMISSPSIIVTTYMSLLYYLEHRNNETHR